MYEVAIRKKITKAIWNKSLKDIFADMDGKEIVLIWKNKKVENNPVEIINSEMIQAMQKMYQTNNSSFYYG